jgi:SAM-dependent methyltransferase
MTDNAYYTRANRAAWDASAPLHASGPDWDALVAAAAKPGFSVLDQTLTNALDKVGVAGKTVVQICCNNGRELLSMPALGAIPALGIDQSGAFLDQASRLAKASGIACDFLCADIFDLPKDIPRDFELGLITIGVLSWMPDLTRFFEIVAGLLAPGAALVIYETHPFLEMFDPDANDPYLPTRSYFDRGPFASDEAITYDGSDGGKTPASYWFCYNMGEIVTSAIKAGLRVEELTEFPHSNREVEFDIYQNRKAQVPMCYLLVLRK